ncbi:MAG TPA: multidrug effflux MFS transporter [Aquabacterium sp.]|uniref:multidrug effflux MFS transporter n=1 Tax=Aquabacterium sp. TaxID=1872578 RepID=UPI002E30CB6E|nr:multidrug effflux MFS transporter [Aquabacterium sp.]HEX5355927.1 multidrug effflux MFS transporter [Aquabacterium sp.]
MSVSEHTGADRTLPAWVVITALSLLTGLQPITTDLYLPALPQMQRELGLDPSHVQWTLSAMILAFGFGQLIWGPISDRFGRRPVLRWGLGFYVLASGLTMVAHDLSMMILARVAQGASLSAAVMCGRAMIRDLYVPEQGARMMAKGMSGLGVLALAGPILGGLTATHFGWRATMGLLGLFGLATWAFIWTRLPETLPDERRQHHLHWGTMARNWWQISKHPTFRAHAMLTSSTYGGLFVYLALSSFVFIDVLGTSRTVYGLGMSTLSLSYLMGTFLCRRLLPRRGLVGTVRMAGWCSLAGGTALVLVSVAQWLGDWHVPAWSLLPGMWLYAFAHGIHQPCGQTGVVSAFPTQAGAASALSGFVLSSIAFMIGAFMSWWTSLPAWAGTIHPMTLGMGIGGALTAWVALGRVQRDGHHVAHAA